MLMWESLNNLSGRERGACLFSLTFYIQAKTLKQAINKLWYGCECRGLWQIFFMFLAVRIRERHQNIEYFSSFSDTIYTVRFKLFFIVSIVLFFISIFILLRTSFKLVCYLQNHKTDSIAGPVPQLWTPPPKKKKKLFSIKCLFLTLH
jgi:hypothetical protein